MYKRITGRFNRRAIKVEEAQQKILQHVIPLPSERLPLSDCFGRRLAERVHAGQDVPHFPRSGMDGYAVRSENALGASPENPVVLKVTDVIYAGGEAKVAVTTGTAVRIMTGAPMPPGASAVVMLEQTEEHEEAGQLYVKVKHPVTAHQNIAFPGDEIRSGQFLIDAGSKIQPGQAALLATFGYAQVNVHRKPRVGIFSTGSELLPIDAPLTYGKIRNSNSSMLAAQVQHFGGVAIEYGSFPDDLAIAREMIRKAIEEVDIVITSGGVSVGDYDVMTEIFAEMEHDLLFNKVAMRPGSPTTAAFHQGTFLFGLSGNPGACFVGFELFVRPVLLRMQGVNDPFADVFEAELGSDYPKGSPHDRYERGKLVYEKGKMAVYSLAYGKSSMMVSIQDANCLIVVPSGKTGAKKGELVKVIPLTYQ